MRVTCILATSLLLFATASASPAAELGANPLPPLPGSDLTTRTCTQCHSSDVISAQSGTPDDWRRTVDLMIRFGASVNDNDKQEIINYLSQAFPPKPKPAAAGDGASR